ncbi:MAG: endonuclease [bacterium]|nr:endonuclease [bacterium]
MNLDDLYNILSSKYGRQNWWPTTLEGDLYPTYHTKSIDERMRYEIAVGTILTQNTAWTNVKKAIYNLNKLHLMDPIIINSSEDSVILDAIKPSGFYNIKLKRIRNLNRWWLKNNELLLADTKKNKRVNFWRDSLLKVKGIGFETADDILLYCFDLPTFVIDTYTKRIMTRHFNIRDNIDYNDLRRSFMNNLPVDIQLYKEYHALFVKLSKFDCTKKGCMTTCPLRQK